MSSPPAASSSSTNKAGSSTNEANISPVILAVVIGIFVIFSAALGGSYFVARVRARNNPQRYGPRAATPGRAGQSKKKGMTLALLESIPIVKIRADNQVTKEPSADDVEPGTDPSVNGASENPATESRQSSTGEPSQVASPEAGVQSAQEDHKLTPTVDEPTVRHTECSICIAEFVESEDVRILPCNHAFHQNCIDPWLLNISGTCPICRYDLQPASLDSLDPLNRSGEDSYDVSTSPIPYVRAQSVQVEASSTLSPSTLTIPPATHSPLPERRSIRSRLRQIRHSAHSGPEYILGLRRLYEEHEQRHRSTDSQRHSGEPRRSRSSMRTMDVAAENQRPS